MEQIKSESGDLASAHRQDADASPSAKALDTVPRELRANITNGELLALIRNHTDAVLQRDEMLSALRQIAERGPNELTRDAIVTLARAAIKGAGK